MDCSHILSPTLQGLLAQVLAQGRTQAGAAVEGISAEQIGMTILVLAVLILPFVIGGFLAKRLKMADSGNRFGFIILAVVASTLTLTNKFPGRGVDLSGGTILVYEMDKEKLAEFNAQSDGARITSEDLIEPLGRRINPAGTQEIVIRPYGETQVEIIVPAVEQSEVDRIKKRMESTGMLQFAILANQLKHQAEIDMATEMAQSKSRADRMRRFIKEENEIVGMWAGVARGNHQR